MLTKDQKHILHEEGTEPSGSSSLNYEKREGDYLCAGCNTKLFESNKKYESGSGWPSFFEARPSVFETKIDNSIGSISNNVLSGSYDIQGPGSQIGIRNNLYHTYGLAYGMMNNLYQARDDAFGVKNGISSGSGPGVGGTLYGVYNNISFAFINLYFETTYLIFSK